MSRTLEQWLTYLETLHPSDIELGLDRVARVAQRLQSLRPAPLTILVGGTNGKGTTTALMSALLQAQGLSVGMYNSPHIQRYNERVSVNGEWISDEDLCRSFVAVEQARGDVGLTYFEFGTLAALWHFQQQSLDVCLLEIGLGGRLDAVNVADADLTVVTSIGLDHQAWLGDTVEEIAYEKCAIARAGQYLVCGQMAPPVTVAATVLAQQGCLMQRGQQFDITPHQLGWRVRYQDLRGYEQIIELGALHVPYHNVATAIQALALVDRLPKASVVTEVVEHVRVAGRLQSILWHAPSGPVQLTLDVAHNAQAAAYLAQQLPVVDGIIVAMLADKPVCELVAALPSSTQLVLAGLSVPRGLSANDFVQRLQDGHALRSVSATFESVAGALTWLGEQETTDRPAHWLIAGSFYTVQQALDYVQREPHAKSF